ncbi:MAG: hypothetical protein AB2693_33710 [Candidatus Thiodiazotropha sp.]
MNKFEKYHTIDTPDFNALQYFMRTGGNGRVNITVDFKYVLDQPYCIRIRKLDLNLKGSETDVTGICSWITELYLILKPNISRGCRVCLKFLSIGLKQCNLNFVLIYSVHVQETKKNFQTLHVFSSCDCADGEVGICTPCSNGSVANNNCSIDVSLTPSYADLGIGNEVCLQATLDG